MRNHILPTSAVAVLLAAALLAAGCQDLEEEPYGFLTPDSYLRTADDFETFVLGVYQAGTLEVFYGEDGYHDLLSDEYDVDPLTVRPFRFSFNEYTHTPNDFRDDNLWLTSYTILNGANTVLARLGDADALTEEAERGFRGEALYLRAQVAFSLVRLFGDIPFYTAEVADPSEGSSYARVPAEEVYAQIVEDLTTAAASLPDTRGLVRSRASRASALALLAQVHLTLATYNDVYAEAYDYRAIDGALVDGLAGDFENHWAAAAAYALEVVDDRDRYGVALVADMQDLFNGEIGDTREHIFSIDYDGTRKGGGAPGALGPGGLEGWRNNNNGLMPLRNPDIVNGWNTYVPPRKLYDAFLVGDYRREVSFATEWFSLSAPVHGDTLARYRLANVRGLAQPHSAKWTRLPGQTSTWPAGVATSHNQAVMRLGELMLIAAEALNEIGRTARALELVNELRARARGGRAGREAREAPADLPTELSQDEARTAIWRERTYELAFEFERWHDLVRRDSLLPVIARFVPARTGVPVGGNVRPHHILLPIPQLEVDKTGMRQNRGY